MSDELPRGWSSADFFDFCVLQRGYDLPLAEVKSGSYPVVTSAGVVAHHSEFKARGPGVVTGRSGSIGRVFFVESDYWPHNTALFVKDFKGNDPKYVHYFLRGFDITKYSASTAVPTLNRNNLRDVTVSVPPLPEQRRIVAKLETLLGKVDASQQRLAKIPVLLKRFRQSVLAAACSGRLTADWREENPNCEDALALVQQINDVRRAVSGTQSQKRGKSKLEELVVEILEDTDCPDSAIPDSWVWVRFGGAIGELRNGVGLRPNHQPPGIPMLRSSAVRQGSVDLHDYRHMPNGERFLPAFAVRDRDLFFTRYSGSMEFVGACAMVRGLGKTTLLYPDKLMRVRFDHDFILPEYAEVFFQSVEAHERIVAKSKSSAGQNGVSGSDIKAQPLALAPLPEQQEIVRRVEGLFALSGQLEVRLAKARGQVDALTPSLLARAFAGQLVPQDPTDEPAEKLLDKTRSTGK